MGLENADSFHLLSDGKTVRRLPEKEFWKLHNSKVNYKLAHIWDNGVVIFDKENTIYVPRTQLEQALKRWDKK